MTLRPARRPRRFQRRLAATYIAVAAVSAGVVAVVTVLLAREYRWNALREAATDETRLALALAPVDLGTESFDRFLGIYEQRSDAHVLAVQGDRFLSSSAELKPVDVPPTLVNVDDEPRLAQTDVGGEPMLVSGALGRDGVRYYLFVSLRQYHDGLTELIRAAALAWGGTVSLAGGVGWLIARRILRPIRSAAAAADALAGGNLRTRLADDTDDELGTLARSFNNMADEVQDLIEQLGAAAERERRFSADVAHELRTPLTGMSAAATLLDDRIDALPPSARQPAEILIHDVSRLRRLVVELLELAALDDSDPPPVTQLDLEMAVTTVLDDAEGRRAADIEVDIGAGIHVLAEPAGLRRILGNLVDNATKHGGGGVVIRGRVDDVDGAFVRVDVTDGGPGIAPQEVDSIFERFHKADRSRSGEGTGLGLAIARRQARRQGGDLVASNDPAGGARFTLKLPRAGSER